MPQKTVVYASVGPELTQYDLDIENATFSKRGAVTLPANVHYAWPHASRQFLYVASSDSASGIGGPVGQRHNVSAFRIDPASGALIPHGDPIALPTRPIHMTSDIPSRNLLVAFSNPSGLRVYRVNPDGTPGAEVAQAEPDRPRHLRASGARQPRQSAGYPGHARPRRRRRQTRGAGRAEGFQLSTTGRWTTKFRSLPAAATALARAISIFTRRSRGSMCRLERQNRLDMFAIDGDRLSGAPLFSKGTLGEPGNIRGRQAAGTVHVHPNGRFVYVANRASSTVGEGTERVFAGGENTLAVYAIDPVTGEPSPIQHVDTRGIHCRTFHIDPSGQMLVAAHIMGLPVKDGAAIREVPACLSVFRIGADGKLDFVRKYDVDVGNRQMFWMGMV